jgi:hypothetical protein
MWILKNLEGAVLRICPRNSWSKVTGVGQDFKLGTLGYGAHGWAARNDVRLLIQLLKILRILLGRFMTVLGVYRNCHVCINLFLELRNTPGSRVSCVDRAMPSGGCDGTPLEGTVSWTTQYELHAATSPMSHDRRCSTFYEVVASLNFTAGAALGAMYRLHVWYPAHRNSNWVVLSHGADLNSSLEDSSNGLDWEDYGAHSLLGCYAGTKDFSS